MDFPAVVRGAEEELTRIYQVQASALCDITSMLYASKVCATRIEDFLQGRAEVQCFAPCTASFPSLLISQIRLN